MTRKAIHYATFIDLLVQRGGDFASAYADLAEQYEDVPSEAQAQQWAADMPQELLDESGKAQLRTFLKTGNVSLQLAVAAPIAEQKELAEDITAGALRVLKEVMNDTDHKKFDGKTRSAASLKFLELRGTFDDLRTGKTPAQQAHRAAPQISTTFGTIPDRLVFQEYVRCGLHTDRLTEWLRLSDNILSGISTEAVERHLLSWQRNGVVMGPEGEVMAWDDAVLATQTAFRIATPDP